MSKCQVCERVAPVAQVTLYRNIGMLVARQWSSVSGLMCRDCARSQWWSHTVVTMVVGWWGIISFFANIFAVLNNVAYAPTVFGIPRDGEGPVTKSRTAMLVIVAAVGLVLFGPVACARVASYAAGSEVRRIQALRQSLAAPRTAAVLTQETACGLAEEAIASREIGHWYGTHPFTCAGPMKTTDDHVLLEGVSTNASEPEKLGTVCLKRSSTRWFAIGVDGCIEGPLADLSGTVDQQERAWRDQELKAHVAKERAAVDAKIVMTIQAIATALDSKSELPVCSLQALQGRRIPYQLETMQAALVRDDLGVPDSRFAFINSLDIQTTYGLRDADGIERTGAMNRLRDVRFIAVLGQALVSATPEVSDSGSFISGAYLSKVYLADLDTKTLLCWRFFAFMSSDDLLVRTPKYASKEAKRAVQELTVDRDFRASYQRALNSLLRSFETDKADAKPFDSTALTLMKELADDENGERDELPGRKVATTHQRHGK